MNATPNASNRFALLNRAAVFLASIFVLSIPFLAANFRMVRDSNGEPLAGDFVQEYMGAYIVLHGDQQRFYDLGYADQIQHDPAIMGMTYSADRFLPMIYPPFYYLLLSPLALLSYYTAALLWLFLMAGCLMLAVWLLVRAYPEHPALLAWGLAGAFFFAPVLQSLVSCQKGTLALLILTATFLLLKRRRPFWAGLIFGLLAFKPQLTLVIALAMLCKRQWRFVLGGMATGAVLVGLSLLTSLDACEQYLHLSRTMAEYINTSGFPLEQMHCWYGFWKLLLSPEHFTAVQTATLLTDGLTVALVAWLLWGPLDFDRPRFAGQFAGLVLATILLSPHLLTYDLTLLLLPFFLLTHRILTHTIVSSGQRRILIWLLALLYAGAIVAPLVARWTHLQFTVLLIFALLATLARSRPDCDAPTQEI